MFSRRVLVVPVLAVAAVGACLEGALEPLETYSSGEVATTDTGATTGATTGDTTSGLFGCASTPCTLLLVSQTLDDRIDVFDVGAGTLRGRIALDLKPDASGKQTSGNLLDEPYDLVLTDSDLLVAIGHYPDTDQGSLLRFPRALFADMQPGEELATSRYFKAGVYSNGVTALAHGRREGIFLLAHPGGRVLVGVFANNLQTTQWTTPSEVLVVDPADLTASPGSIDLGALPKPCIGGWRLEALDAAVSKVAIACDGSESVGVLSLPADFATATLADAAAGVTGCGLNLAADPQWSTQFVASDGGGGFLAVQSQVGAAPKLWHVGGDCDLKGLPADDVPDDLKDVRLLRQPALLRPVGAEPPLWLVAAGPTHDGVVVVRGGSSPALCGALGGLELLAAGNSPWALALDGARAHLAVGAGPTSNPQTADGRGQVLWAKLEATDLDACQVRASQAIDLNAGMFAASDSSTWSRAPNVMLLAELGGEE
mgnify:CR=1 FL=1